MTNQLDKLSCESSVLSTDIITAIKDILIKPTLENPYQTLREWIIAQLIVSKLNRITQLLEQEELGVPHLNLWKGYYSWLRVLLIRQSSAIFFTAATRKIQTGTGVLRRIFPNICGGRPCGRTTSHTIPYVNDFIVSLIKELRDEQRRLLARVDL